MQVSDVADLIRGHLLEGETLTEEPSDAYGDRMLTVATAASIVHVYILDDMYGIATLDVFEAWKPGDRGDIIDRTIDIVLDYARRGGKPAPAPDPGPLFAPLIELVRPELQEEENISSQVGDDGTPSMAIGGRYGGIVVTYQADRMSALTSDGRGSSWPASLPDEGLRSIRSLLRDVRTRPHRN